MSQEGRGVAASAIVLACLALIGAAGGCGGGVGEPEGPNERATAGGGRRVNEPAERTGRSRRSPYPCPENALPLQAGAEEEAEVAALAEVSELYGRRGTDGAQARARRAPAAGVRGRTANVWCGPRAFLRTVVVFLFFPERSFSASLSSGVVLVSRFEDGYRVWGRVH